MIASSTFSYLCICLSLLALLAVAVEFEAGDYTVLEDDGFVEVVLLKIGSSDIPVSVLLTTSTSSSASGTKSQAKKLTLLCVSVGKNGVLSIVLTILLTRPNSDTLLCYCSNPFLTECNARLCRIIVIPLTSK